LEGTFPPEVKKIGGKVDKKKGFVLWGAKTRRLTKVFQIGGGDWSTGKKPKRKDKGGDLCGPRGYWGRSTSFNRPPEKKPKDKKKAFEEGGSCQGNKRKERNSLPVRDPCNPNQCRSAQSGPFLKVKRKKKGVVHPGGSTRPHHLKK